MADKQQEETTGCACADWTENIRHLDSLLLLGCTHGREYKGLFFRFCPWCGQRLAGAAGQRDATLWEKAHRGIEESFFATDEWGTPQTPNMLVAAWPIADYRQKTGDLLGALELMLADFRDLLLANPGCYEVGDLAQRLSDLGWGYGDFVTEIVGEIRLRFGDV